MNKHKETFTNIIEAFSNITNIPATLIDNNGAIIWETLTDSKFCSIFPCYTDCQKSCIENLRIAAETAINLNEPYLFLCRSNMIKIAFPYVVDNQNYKCFFLGPICMGNSKDSAIAKVIKVLPLNHTYLPKLITFMQDMKVKSPREVSYVYNVFCNCVLPYNILKSNFGLLHEKPAFTPPSDKKMPATNVHYPETLEQDLIYAIKTGDKETALENFRLLYEKAYLMEAGNFQSTKIRLTELFNKLHKTVSDEIAFSTLYIEEFETVHNSYTFSEIYINCNVLIENLANHCAASVYQGDSLVIRDLLDYIKTYYNLNITLTSAAKKVHMNPSYLSTLFKAETNKTFSQYLLETRLENSIKLLINTHMSITQIAMEVGITNQSYYIKMFKKHYGLTPGEYRQKSH